MARECITHHHACDCREERFRELEAENERLRTKLDERQRYIEHITDESKAFKLLHSKAVDERDAALSRLDACHKLLNDWLDADRRGCAVSIPEGVFLLKQALVGDIKENGRAVESPGPDTNPVVSPETAGEHTQVLCYDCPPPARDVLVHGSGIRPAAAKHGVDAAQVQRLVRRIEATDVCPTCGQVRVVSETRERIVKGKAIGLPHEISPGEYVKGPDGCDYDDLGEMIGIGVLGFCGCGRPETALKWVRDMLDDIHYRTNVEWKSEPPIYDGRIDKRMAALPEGVAYLLWYWLTEKDLIEHGGSVGGSWLTELGLEILDRLKSLPLDEEDGPV